jgi:hypothetical protein
MKNLQRMCAATVLTCLLAVSASAGHISAPGAAPPPPPPPPPAASVMATTEGHIPCPGAAEVIAALLGLLSVL